MFRYRSFAVHINNDESPRRYNNNNGEEGGNTEWNRCLLGCEMRTKNPYSQNESDDVIVLVIITATEQPAMIRRG